MSIKDRTKQIVAGGAAAVGLTLGVAALAGAATAPDQIAPTAGEQDAQDQNLNGSIQTPENESATEAEENKALDGLAKVSAADAEKAALAAMPDGKVNGSALENDNGSVIWEVDMTDASGASVEVKVDAGNGKVLAQEANDESAADQGSEVESESDAGEAPEAAEVTPAG